MEMKKWQDYFTDQKDHTISGDIRIMEDFPMPQLNKKRRIWIYLPPGYEKSERRYPVIYMHDGQNVFDRATSTGEEWGVDETMERFASGGSEAIVVAIDHGGEDRSDEYTVLYNEQKRFGGQGEAYVEFIRLTLKPWIDRQFRTKPGSAHTAMIGSSFGAYISLYAGIFYPEVFGRIGALSLMLWQDNNWLVRQAKRKPASTKVKWILQIGDAETKTKWSSRNLVHSVRKAHTAVLKRGYPDDRIVLWVTKDGTHHERTWRELFPDAVNWLLFEGEHSEK